MGIIAWIAVAALMANSAELGPFAAREKAAASTVPLPVADRLLPPATAANGSAVG